MAPGAASGSDRRLLEQSLAVIELDRELSRLASRKEQLEKQLDSAALELRSREQELASRKKRAGEALRNYYTGRQDLFLHALFSVRNIGDLFTLIDLTSLLMNGDRKAIAEYKSKSAELQRGYDSLQQQNEELASMQQNLLDQKARAEELEAQLQEGIGASRNPDELRQQIGELGSLWENSGREKVRTYFRAISKSMNKLPGWLQEHPEYVKLDSSGYTLRLPDQKLNEFLAEQDPSLKDFTFQFKDGNVIAGGSQDNMEVEATGVYEVVDKPKNGLKFTMNKLVFNGYSLPRETMDELLQSFDLGFYPGKIISFLKVASVKIEDSELVITFGFSF